MCIYQPNNLKMDKKEYVVFKIEMTALLSKISRKIYLEKIYMKHIVNDDNLLIKNLKTIKMKEFL